MVSQEEFREPTFHLDIAQHGDMLRSLAEIRLQEDEAFQVTKEWVGYLNGLIAVGSQSMPRNFELSSNAELFQQRANDIRHNRLQLLKELGWLSQEPKHAINDAERLFIRMSEGYIPQPDKVLRIGQVLYNRLGEQTMTALRGYIRLLFLSPETLEERLKTTDQVVDTNEYILKHPRSYYYSSGELLRAQARKQMSGIRAPRVFTGRPVDDSEFVIDPTATSKVFDDGLELTPAEMSYKVRGPLSLERDAGWLALVNAINGRLIDDAYIDALNDRRSTASTFEYLDEWGWADLPSGHPLADRINNCRRTGRSIGTPETVFQSMRVLYAYLGNIMMAPITQNMSIVSRARLATEIEAVRSAGHPVERILLANPSFFLKNPLKQLENGTVPAARSTRRTRRSAPLRVAAKAAPAPQQVADDRYAAPVEYPEFKDAFAAVKAAFGEADEQRQAVLINLAGCLSGGLNYLLAHCPKAVTCTDEILATLERDAEQQIDLDWTDLRVVRNWNKVIDSQAD